MWKNVMVKPRHPHTGAIGHQGEGSFNQKKKRMKMELEKKFRCLKEENPLKKSLRGGHNCKDPPPIIRKKVLFVSIRLFKIRRFLSATVDPRRCFATEKKKK